MPATPRLTTDSPTVIVSNRGAARLQEGHVWVYRSDIVSADGAAPGALVTVSSERGKFLGTALYSSASQIAIRMLGTRPVTDLASLLCERIRDAIAYRERIVHDTEAYRVVFSEGDFLPGLIVDRYGDVLSLQVLTQAMDAAPVRQAVLSQLSAQLKPSGVVERVDARVRQLEQLTPRESGLVAGDKTATVYSMHGVRFHYDGLAGQKTGAYLDQRENYAAAAQYARGTALDVFCYQGGFALHLATRCSAVTGVDSSRPALEMAEQNALLNRRDLEWIEANAFDLLKDYAVSGRKYDTIVLDPPPFARSQRNVATAVRGYKELNLRALKMLQPGGVLVTCSCSYHVSPAQFLALLANAARDIHRNVRILENRSQARDHPMLLTVPETTYLKCAIVTVSN